MLTAGILILCVGLGVSLGAFGVAARNMAGFVGGFFGKLQDPEKNQASPIQDFGKLFAGHVCAMVVMMLGGAGAVVGAVLIILHVLNKAGLL
jgi:hypothetical protein